MKILFLFAFFLAIQVHAQNACSVTMGSNVSPNTNVTNTNAVCQYFTASNQSANTIQVYLYSNGAPVTWIGAIYADSDGSPGSAVMSIGTVFSAFSGYEWQTVKFLFPGKLNGNYWIASYSLNEVHSYNNSVSSSISGTFPANGMTWMPLQVSGFVANTNYAYPIFADECP